MRRNDSPSGKGPDSKKRSRFERCQICSIRHRSICGALSDVEHSELSKIAKHQHFIAGQIIMPDQGASLFHASLRSGVLKLTRRSSDKMQETVGLLFPPDFFSHAVTKMNPYCVEAVTDVDICCFPRAAFEGLARQYPNLEHRLFFHSVREINSERDWKFVLSRKAAEEKVASFLLVLARRTPISDCAHIAAEIDLPLSRAKMAGILGLTAASVNIQLGSLEERGYIRLLNNRLLMVPDYDALAKVAGWQVFGNRDNSVI